MIRRPELIPNPSSPVCWRFGPQDCWRSPTPAPGFGLVGSLAASWQWQLDQYHSGRLEKWAEEQPLKFSAEQDARTVARNLFEEYCPVAEHHFTYCCMRHGVHPGCVPELHICLVCGATADEGTNVCFFFCFFFDISVDLHPLKLFYSWSWQHIGL